MTVSVVIPVKDGERYLEELLAALAREGDVETLVIDSGSRDRSVAIARAAGVEVLEIPADEFGHGRTRNLGAERTSGEIVCFLTQDATPTEGWLEAHLDAHKLDPRVGAAFGPHLPREDTSPMIARELTEFFAGFAPDGAPALQLEGDEPFLSDVNASYARACWEEIRFRDVAYAEDQAFGRDMLAAGWAKVYHPAAGVLHAHDYGALEFMRRYFDEYRGLRETTGHVEPLGVRSLVRETGSRVAADMRWMRDRGRPPRERAAWAGRAVVHHAGRKVASAAGSRASALPPSLQSLLSLERRLNGASEPKPDLPPASTLPPTEHIPKRWDHHEHDTIGRFLREGPAPLSAPVPGMSSRERLHIAVVVPSFRIGSGGHGTVFKITSQLERMGHTCSVWLYDPIGEHTSEWPAVLRRAVVEHFAPIRGPFFKGFDSWYGADVAIATGWQTAYPVMLLDSCRARAYLVNDHETWFYPVSVESRWAEATYRLGLHPISATPWLRDLLNERYGAAGDDFQLGVDDVYRPRSATRRQDTVVFYARTSTPRRGVSFALQALGELKRRRPDVRVLLYGEHWPPTTFFDYEHMGMLSPEQLAWLYSEATVGLSLSLTNLSLVPKEMMACGLPCVELAGISAESVFGAHGPIELAPFDPYAVADAVERLLTDEKLRSERSKAGSEFVAGHTWEVAARQTEAGLRNALRLRELKATAAV